MFEVIICTISSGRVRRIRFANSDAAWACADKWSAKNVRNRTYLVTVERPVTVAPKQLGRTASM
jgi:hypothetical protein